MRIVSVVPDTITAPTLEQSLKKLGNSFPTFADCSTDEGYCRKKVLRCRVVVRRYVYPRRYANRRVTHIAMMVPLTKLVGN